MAAPTQRIASLDIIRGAVMVLMALDHVRVYSGVPPGGPDPGVFFTRWVTNFCAPAFFFLAGTGAYLQLQKLENKTALARYLVTRGLGLVLLELTVIRLSWTFNLDYQHFLMGGVIWSLGWCMVLLALLIQLPLKVVAAVGVVLIAGHDLLDSHLDTLYPLMESSPLSWLWQILYFGGPIPLGADGPKLFILYSLVPWIGVMAAGYAFGAVMRLPPDRRRQICLNLGLGATALFLVLRGFNLYGNPEPWSSGGKLPAVLSFLNPNKYPASLLFLLMTLGPTIALIPLLESAPSRVAGWLVTFGRVPLFFYLLHIPLIHAVAVLVSLVRTPEATGWLFANHPVMVPPPPDGYMWSLPLLHLITVGVVLLLYYPCRAFAQVKSRRPGGLLSYL